MKKLLIFGFSLLLMFGFAGSESSFAQTQTEVKKATTDGKVQVQNTNPGRNFVDKDKNGVCDNNKLGPGKGMGKAKNFKGQNFIDKNNDGKCDNYPDGRKSIKGKGFGKGNGQCDGTGRGRRGNR